MKPWTAMRPWRFAALVAAVAAIHAVLLTAEPLPIEPPGLRSTQAFVTRRIEARPAPAAQPPAVVAKAPAAPRPRPALPIAAPAPSPAPEPTPATATATAAASAPAEPEPAPAPQTDPAQTQATANPAPGSLVPAELPTLAPPPSGVEGAPARLVAIPAPAKIRYDVVVSLRGLNLQTQAELAWRHDGTRYDARLEVGGGIYPSRIQQSSGLITPEGLAPQRFSEKTRNETATHFERDKGMLVFSNNRPSAPLLAGMQDRLSFIVQLAAMIGAAPGDYPHGAQIVLPTAGTRDSDTWIFHVVGDEELDLPGGLTPALKLQRLPRKEFDVKVELWLAPRMDYAPVRVRLTNPNGDSVDQRWVATDRG